MTTNDKVKIMNESIGDLKYYDCPICHNKGVIYKNVDDEVRYTECECMKERKINRTLAKSGLAEQFNKYTLDQFKTNKKHHKAMYDKAIKFLDNPSQVFYVGGQVGSGKTFLCVALSQELIKKGYDFKYLKYAEEYPRLQRDIRSNYTDTHLKAEKEIELLGNVKLLYIDDFLKVGGYDNIFELINARYNKNLITIISSETLLDDIKDESIYSRLYEMSDEGKYVISISKDINKNYRLGEMK